MVRFGELLRQEMQSKCREIPVARIFGDPAGDYRAQTDESTPFQILRGAGIRLNSYVVSKLVSFIHNHVCYSLANSGLSVQDRIDPANRDAIERHHMLTSNLVHAQC